MNSMFVKTAGTVVAGFLEYLAVAAVFPQYSAAFHLAAGLIAGWLHLPQPVSNKDAK